MLGSPAVKTATMRLENGRALSIDAKDQSDKNVYVKKVELNGKRIDRKFITYNEILAGGKLVFFMDDKPNR